MLFLQFAAAKVRKTSKKQRKHNFFDFRGKTNVRKGTKKL